MDGVQSNGRKRKAEDGESPPPAEDACLCMHDCRKDTHQLTENLDNLTLFEMAFTVQGDGNHTLHRGVVKLLLRVVDARPSTWHISWRIIRNTLDAPQASAVRIKDVYDSLRESIEWLENDLKFTQETSIKAPGPLSGEIWRTQLEIVSLTHQIDNLCGFLEWSDEGFADNKLLSRFVHDLAKTEDLETISSIPSIAWSQLSSDDVYSRCDKAASALRTQLLRIVAFYDRHDGYLEFIKQIMKDLETTIYHSDAEIIFSGT